MNRKDFLTTAGAGAALAMAPPGVKGASVSLKDLNTGMSVEERIRRIQTFVQERYYDDIGLLYSHINFEEERPHKPQDLVGADVNNLGIPADQLYNYENSPMNSGIFLAGQCYRYLATKEPEALEYAARAFRSIDVNYGLSEHAAAGPGILMQRAGSVDPNDRFDAHAGRISKPYGQMMTTQTSTEQNFGPIWGLYMYRSIAPEKTRARIDSMIVGIASLWHQIGYKVNFFGENWEFEKSMPRAQRHMPVWAWVNRVAYEISADKRFQREFQRLDALFGAMPTAMQTNFGLGREKYLSTEDRSFHDKEVVVADFLLEFEPSARDRFVRGMTNWWRFGQIGMRSDFTSYYYIELDTVTGKWRPLPKSIKPRPLWNSPSMWQNGTFPVVHGENAARLAVSTMMVARNNPAVRSEALGLAKKLFDGLDRNRFRYMEDPENSLEPSMKFLTNLLSGDALAYYPTAYWYGRYHKLI